MIERTATFVHGRPAGLGPSVSSTRAWQSTWLVWLAWLTFVVTLFASTGCTTVGLSKKKSQDASAANAQLGANYLRRGNLDQARFKLEKALEQDEENALAHVTYAQLQQRIDKQQQARTHFTKAIALEPEEAEHRNSYGIFLCEMKEYDAAIEEFVSAANNPYYDTPEFALDNAGLCMLDADRLDAAETQLRDALRRNPRFANAYLHMAELLRRQGRLTVSDAYFQRFQAYGDDTAESLLLGLNIRRDAGDIDAAEQYASRLLNEFPASEEAGEYLSQPLN